MNEYASEAKSRKSKEKIEIVDQKTIKFSKGNLSVYVNVERGIEIARVLEESFTNGVKIFSNTQNLIENQVPEGVRLLSKEHILFLFYIAPLDYLMKSELLYNRAKIMFKERPELFDPSYIANTFNEAKLQELANILQKYLGVRFPFEAANRWYKNSLLLLQSYEGDPRNIFKGITNARNLFERISKFRGLGRKTGSMLLRCLIDLGIAKVDDINDILPPVDIHDVRIAFRTKIAYSKEYSEGNARKFTRIIQDVWSYVCKKGNLNWLKVDRALWLLGSNGCAKKNCKNCPINNFCIIGSESLKEYVK
jgi:endonuclease III